MAEGTIETAQEDIDFAERILQQVEANMGIPLAGILLSGDSTATNRVRAYAAIREHCLILAESEHNGDGAGLLLAQKTIDETTEPANVVPSYLVDRANLDIICGYEGTQLGEYVKSMVNALALIQSGESPEIVAAQIVGAGVVGFGGAFAFATIRALIAGQVLKQAVLLGLKAAGGVAAVVGVVLVIIVELLFYLLHENKKDFVGIVFNNSDQDLVVTDWRAGVNGEAKGDLYMAWGSATGFMESHLDGDLRKVAVQLPARAWVNKTDYLVSAGIFSASKNFGLKGAEGAFVLHPLTTPTPRFALLFECPYFQDNGVNVAVDDQILSAKSYYERLDGSRGISKVVERSGFRWAARVAAPQGGEALGLAFLDQL